MKWQQAVASFLLFLIAQTISTTIVTSSAAVRVATITKCKKRFSFISDGAKEGLASALATSVVKTILQPLDTIKTVQQGRSLGPIKAAAQIIKLRGIGGLWSGLGVTVIGSAPSAAVYFGIYGSIKRRLLRVFPQELKLVVYAISAGIGNTVASAFRVPYEVIKQRVQMGLFPTAWDAIVDCWMNEGVSGLFGKGKLTSQIMRDVPYAIAVLVTYEILQSIVIKHNQSQNIKGLTEVRARENLSNAMCGSIAGGFGSFVTNPMDVIKTRMMTSSEHPDVITAARLIFQREGAGAFMIGVSSRLTHKVPANALFFLCYEWFRGLLDVESKPHQ